MVNVVKMIGFLVAAMVFLPLVSAIPFTASFDSPSALSLLEGTSASLPLEIQNNDFTSHTVKISGFSDDAGVKIIPNIKTFVISPYEKATIGITVRALDDADHGTVLGKVKVDLDGQIVEVPVTVYVGTNPYLTLTTFNSVVCAGEYVESISVLVENRTSGDVDVSLHASHPILLPFSDDESVTLENGIEQFVTFHVNVSPQNVGTYTGTIVAETSQIVMVRPFKVSVNDCPTPSEKTISLKVPTKTYDLTKLKTTTVPITVKNLTDEPQYVEFFIETTIPHSIPSITIAPNDTAIINASFTPDTSIPAGKKTINVSAVSSGYSIVQSIQVNVLPLDYLTMQSVNTIYDITEGDVEAVDFVVFNEGDSTQTIVFGTQHVIPGVTFSFTPDKVVLEKGNSAHVRAFVRVAESTSTTKVDTFLVASGKTTASFPISFSILENDDVTQIPLTFVSVPAEMSIDVDSQKEFLVTVQNNSDTSVLGVRFKLSGVNGAFISVISPTDVAIAPHETKTIALKLVTQEETRPGLYSPILVAQGTNGVGNAPFALKVNGGFGSGLLTGLVTFANERAGILGFIVLVILAVFYLVSRSEKRSPAWTAK